MVTKTESPSQSTPCQDIQKRQEVLFLPAEGECPIRSMGRHALLADGHVAQHYSRPTPTSQEPPTTTCTRSLCQLILCQLTKHLQRSKRSRLSARTSPHVGTRTSLEVAGRTLRDLPGNVPGTPWIQPIDLPPVQFEAPSVSTSNRRPHPPHPTHLGHVYSQDSGHPASRSRTMEHRRTSPTRRIHTSERIDRYLPALVSSNAFTMPRSADQARANYGTGPIATHNYYSTPAQTDPASGLYPTHARALAFNRAVPVGASVHHHHPLPAPGRPMHLAAAPVAANALPVTTAPVPVFATAAPVFVTAFHVVAVVAIPHSGAMVVPSQPPIHEVEYNSAENPSPAVQVRHHRGRRSRKGAFKRVLKRIRDFFS
ncbi:hypothetical protein HGRIS_003323 [Hohenbuehelia grisea]|uniref:Uncharacterized protein n=1 Tax=Hohenbuehelia grisea TaxID=104357 RepID=A0ABR3JGP9_9AGAR